MRPRAFLAVPVLLVACAARQPADTPAAVPAPSPAPTPLVAPTPAPAPERAVPGPAAPSADLFERTVRPILARTCTPCHVPGGKMYDRLPFDDPEVVRSKRESIMRRLKAPEDRRVLEEWLSP